MSYAMTLEPSIAAAAAAVTVPAEWIDGGGEVGAETPTDRLGRKP